MACVHLCKTIYDYQTLIAGIFAVGAAWWTIDATTSSERKRLKRQMNAGRITLPLVLSGIGEWAQAVGRLMMETMPLSDSDESFSRSVLDAIRLPPVPSEHVAGLKLVIEATDDEAVINRISKMVANIQVLDTRMTDVHDPKMGIIKAHFETHLIDAAIIWAEAASLFDFARRKSETTQRRLTWDEVRSALKVWLCYGPAYDRMYAMVDMYASSNPDPEHDSDFGVKPR